MLVSLPVAIENLPGPASMVCRVVIALSAQFSEAPSRVSSGAHDTPETQRLHARVEDLLQSLELGPAFAGAWIDERDRNHIYIAFAGERAVDRARNNPALAELVRDPHVTLLAMKFSVTELVRGIERIMDRLNGLLDHSASGHSAFEASVNSQQNRVDVVIDCSHFNRRGDIEGALHRDISSGLAHISYADVAQQVLTVKE